MHPTVIPACGVAQLKFKLRAFDASFAVLPTLTAVQNGITQRAA